MSKVIEKFLNYVKIDTRSDENSTACPTTAKQHNLAKLLVKELEEMGAEDITYDTEHCYVYASIPASEGCDGRPVLGFIAHMDTAPAVTGENVKPRIIENYDGKDIVLNEEKNIVMKVSDFPELVEYTGKRLIVTDGTTLLGADDKAGIAEIMTMAEQLLSHKEIPHGKIRIGFTPDEEVGAGADHFDVKLFGADYAYTVDGGKLGELEYENFNAAGAKVTFHGRSVHPGDAKNKMVNALLLAMEFQNMLPVFENPMYTEKYEGFYHLDLLSGSVEKAQAEYIIRDHDKDKFEQKKELLQAFVEQMNRLYPGSTTLELRDQYYNMREVVEPKREIIDVAFRAMEAVGVTPLVKPIRGGTDGARLSFMGLPCPNLFAGGLNFHGRYEFLPVPSLEKSMQTIIKIAEFSAQ